MCEEEEVQAGAPQGAVLPPLLFVSDVNKEVKESLVKWLAGDITGR